MWRFVLRENIRRYETLLAKADLEDRDQLRGLLEQAEVELGELERASTPGMAREDAALKLFAEHCVEEAVKLHGAQFSTLQIYDEQRERLIILAQRNFRAAFLHHLALTRPGDGSACGRCLEDGRPAVIRDVEGDAGFEPHREAAREAGFEAVQASPVLSRSGKVIAVLSTYFSSPQRLSSDDVSRIARHAEKIGAGLERHLPA